MAVIKLTGDYNDPWSECSSCDMRFQLIWQRNAVYSGPEFCPFCGEEVEETIDELE
jgi:hypothetical protein